VHHAAEFAVKRAAALLFIVTGAALLGLLSRGFPNLFLEDDAYFYLQIAWNIGTGHGSTFDGLHVTNGYHLLWMGMLAPTAWLAAALGLGKGAFVTLVCALGLTVALLSAVTTFRQPLTRMFAVLLFLFCGLTMESTVLGALALVVGRMFLGEIRPGLTATIALAALLPLARIDFVWFVPALAMLAAIDPRNPRALRLVPATAGTTLGAVVHLLLERLLFGTWSSVSSAYKADLFADRGLALLQSNVNHAGNQLRYAILIVLMGVAAAMWRSQKKQAELYALAVVAAPIAVHTVVNSMRDWYFLPSLLLATLLASHACEQRPRLWTFTTASASAVMMGAFGAYLLVNASDWARARAFVEAANARLADDSVTFQVDGAGFTGWSLRGHVVNGDGLVNSWSYRELLLRNELGGYLAAIGATHVITNSHSVGSPLLAWHGVLVGGAGTQLIADAGPARNALVHYRLFALNQAVTVSPSGAVAVR